jgi:hypothetical protein
MKCLYRNCHKNYEGRPNKKYCSTKCKRNEAKYRKRIKEKNIKMYRIKYNDDINKKLTEIIDEV